MLRHFDKFPPDLIVLATHQRAGIERWLHKAVARTACTPITRHDSFCSAQRQRLCFAQRSFASTEKNSYPYGSRSRSPNGARQGFASVRGLDCVVGKFRLIHVESRSRRAAPVVHLPNRCGWSFEITVRQVMLSTKSSPPSVGGIPISWYSQHRAIGALS